ncbi:uncharacterized protein LTR77_009768 [Saxophila tyrrhenica]|uniref:FAD/NAD(P)-binding domain-containing protein n=1 Tax=Saxophila tyrrhenica TaxID=1690608 RepID=A0AAV9NXA0_9PEZI|nr:hypothetical protein LTR77_009768 [Saxophila tyrrhenica]
MQSAEVIVIGAGIGGLCAAKTYKELASDTELLILESRATVGGVWAKQNLYEGIKTNNLVGTYEFSDFPLLGEPKYGLKEGQHIPGHIVYQYLEDYAQHFDIHRLIQFHTDVKEIEKLDNGWRILATRTDVDGSPTEQIYSCKKLIMSNGLASTPRPVSLPGMESFDRPLFNHSRLPDLAPAIAKDPSIHSVTVIGASKIGYDAVYLFASHGKNVNWIVRESGGGAVWMSPPWIPLGPWTVMLEHVVTTRLFTWFSPCVWGEYDGFAWADTVEGNGYRKEKSLAHLEPRESLFWNARVGIHNYASDVHDYLRSGQVTLHRKDVDRIGKGGHIAFSDGSTSTTDALIAITGWQLVPRITYKPAGIDADLGVPSTTYTPQQASFWTDLDSKADAHILGRFPYLQSPPEAKLPITQTVTPFRLYRGIAPPALTARGDHSLAFMKMVHCTANLILAETQALWVFAYLKNQLSVDREGVYWDTALTSRYGKHRYPWGFSAWWPEFVYDVVPYADMLLSDLGLRRWRKGWWWREVGEGYTVHDYKGICGEWRAKQKRMQGRIE